MRDGNHHPDFRWAAVRRLAPEVRDEARALAVDITPSGAEIRLRLADYIRLMSVGKSVTLPSKPAASSPPPPTPNPPPPSAPVERLPKLTAAKVRSYLAARLGGALVPADVKAEREAICEGCDYARKDPKRGLWCSRCGCGVDPSLKAVRSLAAFEEKLDPRKSPKGVVWGCKHPRRSEGEGWKR